MTKKLLSLLLTAALIIVLSACSAGSPSPTQSSSPSKVPASTVTKLKISVSFNALKEFATAVGGDRVEISVIVPDGSEPHDFEPKAQDIAALSRAQIFVYNGLGMEAWAENAVKAAGNTKLIVVDSSKGIMPIKNTEEEEIKEHGQYDPHIWLSLKSAQTEVANIKDALIKADPAGKDYYEKNSAVYIAQLENLYNEYREKIGKLNKKNFVTGHAAFAYLCRDFGLSQESVEDVFAEGEPSAKKLAELVEYCRKNKVTTIFAEEMASPGVSKTLASEVGAKVETIFTMEGAENGKTYLERMKDNLVKIYDSLK